MKDNKKLYKNNLLVLAKTRASSRGNTCEASVIRH